MQIVPLLILTVVQNGVTMGLARVGGMCSNQHNCVIGELGVTNTRGKPYPSAGFTAIFVMAHEVGHNLGMFHDDTVSSQQPGQSWYLDQQLQK